MENNVVEIIKNMYLNKESIDSIIKAVEMSEKDIRSILKEKQLDRQYNTFSDELYGRIIELYVNGMTQDEISNTLLVSRNGIVKTLDRNNVHRRTYSENNQKYYRDSHYFDCIDTQNKAYILGLLYADGCNHVEHNAITLSLQDSDEYLINSVKDELKYDGCIRKLELSKKNPNYKDQSILVINDEHMSNQLEKCGVINAKSLVLKFPDFLNEELIRHFCRGYFDGDGCIYYDVKRDKFTTCTAGTAEFCRSLSDILLRFGCKNNIRHPSQCLNNTEIIRTSGNKSSYKFLSWMYEDCDLKMERKFQKYLLLKQHYE